MSIIFSHKTFSSSFLLFIIIIIDSIVPLIIWPYGSDYFYYPKINVIYILLILAILAAYIGYKINTVLINYPKEFIPPLFFLVMIILSAIFSDYKYQAFFGRPFRWEGAGAYFAYFLILFFSYISIRSIKDVETLIKYILISASVMSIYGILQYFGIDPIPRDSIRENWQYNSFGTTGNKNFLGSYLSIVLPISMWKYLGSSKKTSTVFLFISSALAYAALLCTMTRSAWLGTILCFLVTLPFLIKYIRKKIKRLCFLLILFFLITFVVNGVHDNSVFSRFNTIVDDSKKIVTNDKYMLHGGSQRLFIWYRTMDYIFDRPILGSGPDTFDKIFKMSNEESVEYYGTENFVVDKAHNEYLQIAVTMGFPAFIFYICFLAMVLYKSILSITERNFVLILGLMSGIIAYIVQAFFNISVVSVAPLYWSVLGLLTALNNMEHKRPSI